MERNTAYLPVLNLQTKTPPSSDCAGLDFSSLFGFLTVLNFIKTASQGALLTLQRFVSYTTHWATPATIRWGREGTATRHAGTGSLVWLNTLFDCILVDLCCDFNALCFPPQHFRCFGLYVLYVLFFQVYGASSHDKGIGLYFKCVFLCSQC